VDREIVPVRGAGRKHGDSITELGGRAKQQRIHAAFDRDRLIWNLVALVHYIAGRLDIPREGYATSFNTRRKSRMTE